MSGFPSSNLTTNHHLDPDRESDLDEATRGIQEMSLPSASGTWQEPPVGPENLQPPGTSTNTSFLLMIANTQERMVGMAEINQRFAELQASRAHINEGRSELETILGLAPGNPDRIQEIVNATDALDRDELALFVRFLEWLKSIDPIENCMNQSRAYPYVPNSHNVFLLRTVRAYRNAGEIVPIDLADNLCSLCHSGEGEACGILPCGHTYHPFCFFHGRVGGAYRHLPFVKCLCGRQYNLAVVPAFKIVVDADAAWYRDAEELNCLWTEH